MRLRCQDAWSSFASAFGSTDTWRQLAGYIYGFQGYVNNLLRLDCSYAMSYANKWTLYIKKCNDFRLSIDGHAALMRHHQGVNQEGLIT